LLDAAEHPTALTAAVVVSWAYLYAFAQFFLAWIVTFLYWRKANRWDELARKAREEVSERGASA
jgi:uncharacterized membrane protein (DUF485 family)